MNRLLVAGTNSHVGKTTLALGLMRALFLRGFTVKPFKVGPDFTDPVWHKRAAHRRSINLDAFVFGNEKIPHIFAQHLQHNDFSIIEGVMGLYDGYGNDPDWCSSASIAKITQSPILLVIDGSSTSTSIAAVVMGFMAFDPNVNIIGVVINYVNSERHFELLKNAIEHYCGCPVLGKLSFNDHIRLPSRSLGLAVEHQEDEVFWSELVKMIESNINLDQLISLTQYVLPTIETICEIPPHTDYSHITLAVAKDEAFRFYYEDNLDLIRALGVNIIEFSPLQDRQLPDCDALYLGGCDLEYYGEKIAANLSMHRAIVNAHQSQKPMYAECGSLLYLGQDVLIGDDLFPMVGILEGQGAVTKSLQNFGYCYAKANRDNAFNEKGALIRGHHYNRYQFHTDLAPLFTFYKEDERGARTKSWQGGYQVEQTLASLMHLHFGQESALLTHFLDQVAKK